MHGKPTMASNYDVSYEKFRRFVRDNPDILNALSKQTQYNVDVAVYRNHMARWLALSEKDRVKRGRLTSW